MIDSRAEKLRTIAAFRKYTRLGLASHNLTPFQAYKRIQGVSRNYNDACNLLAVYDTMRILKFLGKNDTLEAVKEIYFDEFKKQYGKNDFSRKIADFARDNFCDERTVYRHLAYARKLYLSLRGDY